MTTVVLRTPRAVMLALACALTATPTRALEIVRNGQPVAAIVIPEDAGELVQMAAGWVQGYVAKASGATLALVPETQAPAAGALIAIGPTKLAQQAGITPDGLRWDGCRLAVRGRALFLVGRDEARPNGLTVGAHGTGRAATTFLEEFVGIHWFLPGPEGEWVPRTQHLSVPDDLSRTVNPAFAFLSGDRLYGLGTPAAIANNYRTAVRLLSYGGHSYYSWLPTAKYFRDHPEYFASIGGVRNGDGNHLCSTNPEVAKILLGAIRAEFDRGYDWVQLGQEDGYVPCECPACAKLDTYCTPPGTPRGKEYMQALAQNPCERLLLLHKWLADQCRVSHPDKTVHLLVYDATLMPSKRFEAFGDNVVAECCSEDPVVLDAWRGKVRAQTAYVYWWYGLKGIRPVFTPRQVAEHVRALRDRGVIGIFQTAGQNWGLEGPAYYALGRLVGNPDLDPDALVDEYCRGVFPEVATRMKGFFDLLNSRVCHADELDGLLAKLGGNLQDQRFSLLYTPAFLQQLDGMLQVAEKQATEARTQGWLRLTREHLDYLLLVSRMFAAARAFETSPTSGNLAEVRQQVTAFEDWREKVVRYEESYTGRWFPGYDSVYRFLTHRGGAVEYYAERPRAEVLAGLRGEPVGFGENAIRGPLTWDFARLSVTVGKAPRAAVVKRTAQPPRLDGKLESVEWAAAGSLELAALSGSGTSPAGTSVWLSYDAENLYVGWQCQEPEIAKLKVGNVVHDGPVYDLDCVELLLDPSATRDGYRHLMAAACEGAVYDGRVERVLSDPARGISQREDTSWDPAWQVAFSVDAAASCWTVEMQIPFASLGRPPPAAGEEWLGNFGRERYLDRTGAELYLWSPGETGSFRDVFAFGSLYFDRLPESSPAVAVEPGASAAAAAPGNLVVNSSFEDAEATNLRLPAGWEFSPWPGGVPLAPLLKGVGLSTAQAHSGKTSLRIDPPAMDHNALAGKDCHLCWHPALDVQVEQVRGKLVRLTAWVWFEIMADLGQPNPLFVLQARAKGALVPGSMPEINITPAFLAEQGYPTVANQTGRWIRLEVTGKVPLEAESLYLHCGLRARYRGEVNGTVFLVDDVSVRVVDGQ